MRLDLPELIMPCGCDALPSPYAGDSHGRASSSAQKTPVFPHAETSRNAARRFRRFQEWSKKGFPHTVEAPPGGELTPSPRAISRQERPSSRSAAILASRYVHPTDAHKAEAAKKLESYYAELVARMIEKQRGVPTISATVN
jgi:membrane-bound lytic murein transglycosylase B